MPLMRWILVKTQAKYDSDTEGRRRLNGPTTKYAIGPDTRPLGRMLLPSAGRVQVSPLDRHRRRVSEHRSSRLVCSGSWTNPLIIGLASEPPAMDAGRF